MYKLLVSILMMILVSILFLKDDKSIEDEVTPELDGSVQTESAILSDKTESERSKSPSRLEKSENSIQKDEFVVEIRKHLKDFYMNANRIQSGAERAKVFKEWMGQTEKITWFESILSQPHKHREVLSATELAMARVYGIMFMEYLADQGQQYLLVSTIEKVVQGLEEDEESNIKGRERDLADLAAVYIRSYSEEDVQRQEVLIQIMRDLRLHRIDKVALKEILDDELYTVLYRLVGKKEASQLLDTVYSQI